MGRGCPWIRSLYLVRIRASREDLTLTYRAVMLRSTCMYGHSSVPCAGNLARSERLLVPAQEPGGYLSRKEGILGQCRGCMCCIGHERAALKVPSARQRQQGKRIEPERQGSSLERAAQQGATGKRGEFGQASVFVVPQEVSEALNPCIVIMILFVDLTEEAVCQHHRHYFALCHAS